MKAWKVIAAQAFSGREWNIVEADANGLTAGITHRMYECKLIVQLRGQALLYDDDCTQEYKVGPAGAPVSRKSDVPKQWLRNVQSDLSGLLASAALSNPSTSKATASPGDVGNRLQELRRLFDAGLISEEEYRQKRTQILERL